MKEYHQAWLGKHPHRSEEWLQEKLAEGFDIHHIDANHKNNDPENLVLIEHADHMRLHGMHKFNRIGAKTNRYTETDELMGAQAYGLVAGAKLTWTETRKLFWMNTTMLKGRAKRWAEKNGYPWPIHGQST